MPRKSRNALSLLVLALAALLAPAAGARGTAAAQTTPATKLMYIAGGHLWLQSVDGGAARLIRTPWPLAALSEANQAAQWSPDGQRVAVLDEKARLAVVKLDTGHITILLNRVCRSDCTYPEFSWSPNGRYLAVLSVAGKDWSHGTLSVWDSGLGVSRRLRGAVATYFGGLDWSHDSTRLIVGTGKFDDINSVFPSATVLDLQGHARVLGPGTSYGWSPDDRFVGIVRSHECGANTCDDAELVRPAAGGAPTTLVQHIDSNFESPDWAPQPGGYAFDRWILGSNGNFARRLAGPHERVDSWSPDGSHVAVETYHPYEMTPDILYISTPQGSRIHLYTDGRNAGCGACSKDIYRVYWSHNGSLVAFVTPTYPTPKMATVLPRLFLTSVNGGALTRVPVPLRGNTDVLGFVDNDQALVAISGKKIYRYNISSGSLTVLANNVFGAAYPALYPGGE